MCQLYQFARDAREAGFTLCALEQQATRNPKLMEDWNFLCRIGAAKDRYFRLAGRKG